MLDAAFILDTVCSLVSTGRNSDAEDVLKRQYPFQPPTHGSRRYTASDAVRVFIRDGFIDRYSGSHLVFPGTLLLLALTFPKSFPRQPNWKTTETHPAFWQLSATVDHIVPIARNGVDEETNWATTSMLRNSAKSCWLLDELGWHLHRGGSFDEWDGLLAWFFEQVHANPDHLRIPGVRKWHNAARTQAAIEPGLEPAHFPRLKQVESEGAVERLQMQQ